MNILFICPLFHGYYKKIVDILEAKGNIVHYYPTDNLHLSKFDLFKRKFDMNFLYKRYDKYIENIVGKERNFQPNQVVVVYGGLYFKKENFYQLKHTFKNAKFIYYNWDSINNSYHAIEYYNLFDKYYSFDLVDCDKCGFEHLPLFYTFDNFKAQSKITFDYGALMSLGKKKVRRYLQIKNAIGNQYKGKEYLFMSGGKTQFIYRNLLNHRYFKNVDKKNIYFKSLNLEESSNFYDDCKAVIDVPLEGQNGLTIRTFEALRQQKKLITVNKMIKEYEFYTPNNIFIVDDGHRKVPKEFFETPFDTNYSISDAYSIESFVKKLFELN